MSPIGYIRTLTVALTTSAVPLKADLLASHFVSLSGAGHFYDEAVLT